MCVCIELDEREFDRVDELREVCEKLVDLHGNVEDDEYKVHPGCLCGINVELTATLNGFNCKMHDCFTFIWTRQPPHTHHTADRG